MPISAPQPHGNGEANGSNDDVTRLARQVAGSLGTVDELFDGLQTQLHDIGAFIEAGRDLPLDGAYVRDLERAILAFSGNFEAAREVSSRAAVNAARAADEIAITLRERAEVSLFCLLPNPPLPRPGH